MPWEGTSVLDQKKSFVLEWAKDREPKTVLCQRYGISRTLGYEIWKRFLKQGEVGLQDRSRAPHQHPNQVSDELEQQILELKGSHPHAGAPKLHQLLGEQLPSKPPATSTIGLILKRHGLTQKPKRRRQSPPYEQPLEHADEPNRVWCMDFKGWFRTLDGVRCDPLTISDAYSRYLIRCQALTPTDGERVKVLLEAVFLEYGLPEAIRTDNGAPFASCGRGGLSRLAIWWIKLGIRPERIEPGKPQQNGRHERMHRTLKQHTAQPPAANGRAQQRAFDEFQRYYNQQRPHEALGQRRPASLYQPSPRSYPHRLLTIDYEDGWQVRQVQAHGQFSWQGHDVFVSETLEGERIGLEPLDDRLWRVWFGPVDLGIFDAARRAMQAQPRRRRSGVGTPSRGSSNASGEDPSSSS